MKKKGMLYGIIGLLAGTAVFFTVGCGTQAEKKAATVPSSKELTTGELVTRGKYLVTIGGCHDCHSPKKFGPKGMELDEEHLLSGHPAGSPLPPVDPRALKPGHWLLFAGDITAAVGPWGISYAANLTPDSTTGIGAWSETTFVKTLRTGKHLGQEGGRPILPPMPWKMIGQMTDEDLKAVYTYLQSLPPVKNPVPAPVPPTEAAKIAR
ncbi:c-type cytochrome [Pseudoflavitalea sp. X16]|uniref:c-type cytochrome n=1 Tax=Paraflavitalea devenefica TaxID=2716334 RepID=UPI0014231364|nr:c-type cytochrome [Paraflavitalea devenefica]NII27696.1 c-type cytochrome [Paraflavitalea devenefica]